MEARTTNVAQSVQVWGINRQLAKNLIEDGIESYFPVQQDVIPRLLKHNLRDCVQTRDICVSAPTGSGKTIAYALPIVNTLINKDSASSCVRLRALVMLPSRELANQVYSVFCRLARGTSLRVAISTGQTSIADESQQLLGHTNSLFAAFTDNGLIGGNGDLFSTSSLYDQPFGTTGRSAVDVLICTPGRLLEHIQQTQGFCLQHLRFLVLDEADRLLGNAYHSWVRTLIQRSSIPFSSSPFSSVSAGFSAIAKEPQQQQGQSAKRQKHQHDTFHVDMLRPLLAEEQEWWNMSYMQFMPKQPLQRLLFSASLTDNPSKLAMLGVHNPVLIHSKSTAGTAGTIGLAISHHLGDTDDIATATGYASANDRGELADVNQMLLPTGLTESQVTCDTQERLLNLIAIVYEAFSVDGAEGGGIGWVAPSVPDNKDGGDTSAAVGTARSRTRHRGICSIGGKDSGSRDSLKSRGGAKAVAAAQMRQQKEMCIIFSSSVESTHKLCVMLQLINGQIGSKAVATGGASTYLFGGQVEEMSRLMGADQRQQHMLDAAAGKISVLVSSDQLARGIDLPNVRLVINYDPPKFAKAYLHRAGRTARGDLDGHCVTMLKVGQLGSFRSLRLSIGGGSKPPDGKAAQAAVFNDLVPKLQIKSQTKDFLQSLYMSCLKELRSSL